MATADPPPQPSLRRDRTPCCPGSTTRGLPPPGELGAPATRHAASASSPAAPSRIPASAP